MASFPEFGSFLKFLEVVILYDGIFERLFPVAYLICRRLPLGRYLSLVFYL